MKHYFLESFQLTCMGKDNEVELIDIPAPTAKIVACSTLEQLFGDSLRKMQELSTSLNKDEFQAYREKAQEEKEKSDEDDIRGKIDQVITSLAMSGNLTKAFTSLKECLVQSKCMLNGEIRCSASIYDEIPYSELKELLGAYMVNFTNSLL